MEDLLTSDILQPRVQILDLGDQIRHLILVAALNLACLTNRKIQLKLDVPCRHSVAEPTLRRGYVRRSEADSVLAAVCRAECESAIGRGPLLRYNAVVVVKGLLYGDVDTHFCVWLELRSAIIVLESVEVSCWNQ